MALAGCTGKPSTGGGIVSTNPCADALLVRLVAPERIAAISHYSQEPSATSIPLDAARRFHATAGTAEEVIALRPALVLASTFTPPATRGAYGQAGLKVVYLGSPTTVAASVAQEREVAAAVGAGAAGEGMVREIFASLPALPVSAPPPRRRGWISNVRGSVRTEGEPAPPALLYIAGDLATGADTLLDELLGRAGFRNAAAGYGLRYTGRVPLETLAAHPPAVVIAPGDGRTADLRRRLLPAVPHARFDRSLINCGGPAIPPALARLRAIRATLP